MVRVLGATRAPVARRGGPLASEDRARECNNYISDADGSAWKMHSRVLCGVKVVPERRGSLDLYGARTIPSSTEL